MGNDRPEALEERIRRLEDRAEIIELTARYCRAVTNADKEGIASLYIKDGVFDRTALGKSVVQGYEAMVQSYGNSGPLAFLPVIHNHIIAISARLSAFLNGTC